MIRSSTRTKWIAILVIGLMGICVYLGRTIGKTDASVPFLDGSTINVTPGIHLLGNLGPAAAYVVETADGLVLIDSGLDDDAQKLKLEMGKLGLDWKRLIAIFLTHVHGDHCGGAERLRAETGARIYAGQGDVPVLKAGAPREAFFSTFKMPGHSTHPTRVDIALQGDESVSFGDVRFQIIDAPGHTIGSACYLVQRGRKRILFSGDVIQRLGDKPFGTYSAYLAPRYRGDATAYTETLRKLQALPVPDLLLPGHPNSSRGRPSPQLSQQEWKAMFEPGIVEMDQLVHRYSRDGANFLDGHPKQLLQGLYYLGDFHDQCVYGFITDSRLFLIDAPGGPGLDDFLKTRLSDLDISPTTPFAVLLTACGDKETAGLNEIIERNHVRVISSPDGMETIKKRCPDGTTIVSADELETNGWFPVIPKKLGGRGEAPIAYLVKWAGKSVLFSGRIPNSVDQQSPSEFISLLPESRKLGFEYITALRTLAGIKPDLWLPAISVNGQNANIYDDTWNSILDRNYRSVSENFK